MHFIQSDIFIHQLLSGQSPVEQLMVKCLKGTLVAAGTV